MSGEGGLWLDDLCHASSFNNDDLRALVLKTVQLTHAVMRARRTPDCAKDCAADTCCNASIGKSAIVDQFPLY